MGHALRARPDAYGKGDLYRFAFYANDHEHPALPEWTRVDIGARYTFMSPWNGKPIVIRANIENVFNEAYWASAYAAA